MLFQVVNSRGKLGLFVGGLFWSLFFVFAICVDGGYPLAHATEESVVQEILNEKEDVTAEELTEAIQSKFGETFSKPSAEQIEQYEALLQFETLAQEARFRGLDYASLPHTEEGYLKALQIAEMSAVLTALYRYGRYEKTVPYRVQNNQLAVDIPFNTPLTAGLHAKRSALEEQLHEDFKGISGDTKSFRDVFEWRRALWLTRLANYSKALVYLDQQPVADNEKETYQMVATAVSDEGPGDSVKKGETTFLDPKALRNRILTEEPILSQTVTEPITQRKVMLYLLLADVYFAIPDKDFLCTNGDNPDCPIAHYMGWERPQMESLRQQVAELFAVHEAIGKHALSSFMERKKLLAEDDEETFVPLSPLLDELSHFPGGTERYFDFLSKRKNMTEEEFTVEFLREEVAYQLLQPAMETAMKLLRHQISEKIPNRTLDDYMGNPVLRTALLESAGGEFQKAMKAIDAELVETRGSFSYKAWEQTKFWGQLVGLTALFYLTPNKPFAGNRLLHSSIWALRTSLVVTHSYYTFARPAYLKKKMERARLYAGLSSYEAVALAESQAVTALYITYFEILGGVVYAPLISRGLQGLQSKVVQVVRGMKDGSVAQLPTKISSGITRVANEPAILIEKTKTGLVHIWDGTKTRHKRVVDMFKGIWKEMKANPIKANAKAIGNSFAAGAVMIVSEGMARGWNEFLYEKGFGRNLLIIMMQDFAAGFVGSRGFRWLERTVVVTGWDATLEMIGQAVSGDNNWGRMAQRAIFSGFHSSQFIVWKFRYADNYRHLLKKRFAYAGRTASMRHAPPRVTKYYNRFLKRGVPETVAKSRAIGLARKRGIPLAGTDPFIKYDPLKSAAIGTGVYLGNNLLGDVIYTQGTIHLFESGDVFRKNRNGWWNIDLPKNQMEKIWFWLENSFGH